MTNTYRVTRQDDGHTIDVDVEPKSLDTGVYRAVLAAHEQLTGKPSKMAYALETGTIEVDGVNYLRPVLIEVT